MAEEPKIPDWENIWHSGLDYVAPGHEMGSHPAEQGNVTWTRLLQQSPPADPLRRALNAQQNAFHEPNRATYFDIVHTSDYKQEPLPGQWLIFS